MTLVTGTAQVSALNPANGTQVTGTATCGTGVLVGGGVKVTPTGTGNNAKNVVVAASYPSSSTVWTGTGTVIAGMGPNGTMTVQAFALCGHSSRGLPPL